MTLPLQRSIPALPPLCSCMVYSTRGSAAFKTATQGSVLGSGAARDASAICVGMHVSSSHIIDVTILINQYSCSCRTGRWVGCTPLMAAGAWVATSGARRPIMNVAAADTLQRASMQTCSVCQRKNNLKKRRRVAIVNDVSCLMYWCGARRSAARQSRSCPRARRRRRSMQRHSPARHQSCAG
jgi:hypothetical protein